MKSFLEKAILFIFQKLRTCPKTSKNFTRSFFEIFNKM
ncbi:hypothetical protein LEP1GSC021_0229 [Leptospira noguchii str. 1993005606]|nr:hypothetical protein LEP1GSC035_2497 [Leptospira noguchii str. 2007001578]EPE82053.1 hypothetical protein LEP1GSC021_0229 [Leptospira noguchii str. 1993005606]